VATNNPDDLLKFLEKEEREKKLEEIYDDLVKSVSNIFDLLFEFPITPLQDWFLHIIEIPECANALGMPLGGDVPEQVRSILASESGFAHTLRRLIFVRLYETFLITHWLFKNPLCPTWLFEYKHSIEDAMNLIKQEYLEYIKVVEEKNENKINYKHTEIEEAFKQMDWGKFHYSITPYPQWLVPLLRYLNYPHAFGENSIALKDDKKKDIFDKFVHLLAKSAKQNQQWLQTLDLSVLLWCIDTLALNYHQFNRSEKSQHDANKLFKKLLNSLNQKKNALQVPDTYRIKEASLKGVTTPEIFKEIDRPLFFSAAWAFELYLLAKLDRNNPIKKYRQCFYDIIDTAIEYLPTNPRPSHIYLLCLRLWFLLECWYHKSILSAEFLSKNAAKLKKGINLLDSKEVGQISKHKQQKDNNLIKPYQINDKVYYSTLLNRFTFGEKKAKELSLINFLKEIKKKIKKKIEKGSKLPGSQYSVFILGGAGSGKSSLIKESLPKLFTERLNIQCGCIRITPLDIQTRREKMLKKIEDKYLELENDKKGRLLILFIDEIHIPSSPSPFAALLDALEENRLFGKYLGDKQNKVSWNILYVFASSAYSNKEEFNSIARNKRDVAMRDFATRVKYWIKLPELWQIPTQKFIISYLREECKRLSAAITVDGDIKTVRQLNQQLDLLKNRIKGYIKEISTDKMRGNISQLLWPSNEQG